MSQVLSLHLMTYSLSFKAVFGMPYSLAVLFTPILPDFATSMAFTIDSSFHNFRRFTEPSSSVMSLHLLFHPFVAASALFHLGIMALMAATCVNKPMP